MAARSPRAGGDVTMSPEATPSASSRDGRYARLRDLFVEACDLPRAARESFINDRCADDVELRAELDRLLRQDDAAGGLLADDDLAAGLRVDFDAPRSVGALVSDGAVLPERVGRFAVKRILGAGGMGVVYLAQQDNPKRDVAVKVVRSGVMSRELRRRFDLEAAVLARLQHPGIAQIIEAGLHDDGAGGRPYFAMEYINGVPLNDFARDLALPERLRLFVRVCDAVQHAHQRGVVHRDLKPGNILVTGSGDPKVLDFGVARATDSDLQASTLRTDAGQLIGTLAYMSPEQVAGLGNDVDTRSDVYSLGVILYELLAGRPPHDLADTTIAAAARIITEDDPSPPSLSNRSCRGDLDTIVLKALEKEPVRRYQSASDLGADVTRFLNDEPIIARPATTMYQLRKFARRNRGLVWGAAAALLVLVAGAIVSTAFAVGQTAALRESERQRAIADAANQFLTADLIEQVDPEQEADREITLAAALDRAAARIEGRFRDAPLVEANLRRVIGSAYSNLHRLDDADLHLKRALDLYAAEEGRESQNALLCRMELASVLNARGTHAVAESEIRKLLALQRAILGEDHEHTIASINMLGANLLMQGRLADAEPVLDDALARRIRLSGEQNGHVATTMNNLATLYVYTGRHEQAAAMFVRALAVLRAVHGDHHPQTLQTLGNLGGAYNALRRIDDAITTLEESLALHRAALGPEHRSTLLVAGNLAAVYGAKGRNDERAALLAETLAAQERVLGENALDTLVTRMNLAKVAYDRKDYPTAEADYGALLARFETHFPQHFFAGVVRTMHGRCLMELTEYERAEAALLKAHELFVSIFGASHRNSIEAATTLVDLYTRWNRPADADRWRAAMGPNSGGT